MLEKNSDSEVHVEKIEQRPTASIAFGLERLGLIAVQAPILSCIILVVLIVGAGAIGLAGALPSPQRPKDKLPEPPNVPTVVKAEPRVDRLGDPLPEGAVLRIGSSRFRHARAYAVAFTADGKLASFGEDSVVRIWDPASGRQLSSRPLIERDWDKEPTIPRSWGGCFSPDARRLAMQLNNQMKVFDVESGREVASVDLASGYEIVARFSPNGRQVALADQDGKGGVRLRICDVDRNTNRELARIGGFHSEPAFSRDGRRLALATGGAEVVVWDVPSGSELIRFKANGQYARTVEFDASGDVLAILGATNPPQWFQFFRISTGQPPEGWTAPPVGGMEWVRFAPDGATIVLGGQEGGIRRFDPKIGKLIQTEELPAGIRAAFSSDGKLMASAGKQTLRVWDTGTGRSLVPANISDAATSEICGVAVSPDGQWILVCELDTGTIRLCDSQGQPKKVIPSKWRGARHPLFSADGRQLIGMASDAVVPVRWDVPSGMESARYAFAEAAGDQQFIYNFALSPDGQRLAALTQPARLRQAAPGGAPGPGIVSAVLTVWDVATARRIESRDIVSPSLVMYGAFSPDLKRYYFGDRAIALAGGPEFRLELPEGWRARQAAASSDGRLVAQAGEKRITDANGSTIGFEGSVVVHEVATGKQVVTLSGEWCGPIAFTPDSRGLVTTTGGGITRWDLATQKRVVRHKSPGPFIGSFGHSFASSLAVTPDGARAITGHSDSTALVWDLPPPPKRVGPLSERELGAAWDDLSGGDASKAYSAIWALADAAGDAVPFLRQRLRPAVAPPEDQVRKLVAGLDSRAFADREVAEKELNELGTVAAPALRTLLKGGLSAEQTRRVERLLQAADAGVLPPGEQLQQVRAIASLELAGTPATRELLADLAKGAPGARLTAEATASLERLKAR
jgi:WD40 repeat protein